MNKLRPTILALCVTASVTAHANTPTNTDEECVIDDVMAENYEQANELSKNAVEATIKERDIEAESCLPDLSALTAGLNISIADFAGLAQGLATKIKDMACDAAQDSVDDMTQLANQNWSAPYGIASVGTGVGAGDGGVTVGTDTRTSDMVERAVTRQLQSEVNGVQNGLVRDVSDITGLR